MALSSPPRAHWPHVRDGLTENFKNDLASLMTLRGIKVCNSLRSWGYIGTDVCAHCTRKETINHCFLNCKRAKETWKFFLPTLSALLHVPFLANVKTAYFYLWPTAGDKNDTLACYVIKTILYGLWVLRNKATFHNGTETSRAIVRYISNDIKVRLKTDFSRMPPRPSPPCGVTPVSVMLLTRSLRSNFIRLLVTLN